MWGEVKRGMNPRVSGVTGFPINTVKNAYRFVAGRLWRLAWGHYKWGHYDFLSRRCWFQIPTIISQNASSKCMKYRTDTVAINGLVAKGVAIYHVKYVKPLYTEHCVHAPFIRNDCNEKFRNINSEQLLLFTTLRFDVPAIPKFCFAMLCLWSHHRLYPNRTH